MTAFQFRQLRPEDTEGFNLVRSLVYRGGGAVRPDERLLRDDSTGYVIEGPQGIVGAATVLSMTCPFFGEHVPCAGIAAVGVLPEARQSGAGSALMKGLNEELEGRFAMASLSAFRETWYRKFGYITAVHRYQIRCPADRLPAVNSEMEWRRSEPGDPTPLKPVEAEMSRRYCGYGIRTPDQWWRMLGGDTPDSIFVTGDPLEAYCVVKLRDDFWGWYEIKEIAWTTQRGYEAILNLFRQLTLNHLGVIWTEPSDGPYSMTYVDQGVTIEVNRPMMYRVIDESLLPERVRAITASLPTVQEKTRAAMSVQTPYCADFF